MTQIDEARAGRVTDEVRRAAKGEPLGAEDISGLIAAGQAVVCANRRRPAARGLSAIGRGLKVKVNANIGTSLDSPDVAGELAKLRAAVEAGADAVMDLSTGPDLQEVRRRILEESPVTVGTVPIYTAAVGAARSGGIRGMTADGMLAALRADAEAGVDFATVHAGVTMQVVEVYRSCRRICGIVSRGGAFLAHWMLFHKRENPFYERFDEVISIAREHDLVLSLGDGLRPGAIADSFDRAQVAELSVLAELARRAQDAGVQVMIEGPGHVPLHEVAAQVRLAKSMTRGAPFYVLGPLVTDVAPGYDHIVGAIGGAVAAQAGADFLCYVTPAEHLRLPGVEDVRAGVIASRIAGHAADIARGIPGAADWDREVSILRRARKWGELCEKVMDPRAARESRASAVPSREDTCTMCGEYCAFRVLDEAGV